MSTRLWLYILYSVGLHVALLLVLGVSLALSPGSRGTPDVEAIQAVAVDEQEVQKAMERLDEQRNDSTSEAEKRQEEKRLADLEQQRKQEQRKLEELRQQREAEAEKQKQIAEQRQAEEQRRQEQQAKEKAQREAEEQRLAEQRKQEAERQAAEEAQRQAEAEAKRKAEEQARREAAEEQARREAAEEQARKEAELAAARKAAEQARARQRARARERAVETAKQQFIPAIQRRVEQNWLRPSGVPSGLSARIRVRTGPGGMVLGVQVLESSGNDAFDRSAALAARKAEPLPLPSDPNVAAEFRDIDLYFQPDA